MAQVFPRNCPRCGTPTAEGMRFCANCGLPAEAMLVPAAASQMPQQPFSAPAQVRLSGAQAPTSSPAITREDQQPAWRASSAPKKPVRRSAVVLLLVGLLLVLGVIFYIAAGLLGLKVPGFVATQSTITTTPMNTSFPYAGVNITFVNAQQAQNFLDDPNTRSDGMLRLNLRATNNTNVKVGWNYQDVAQLVLPGNSVVKPVYVKGQVDLAPGKTQNSVVDFAVPGSDTLTKLLLRFGAANEAQLDIPLNAHADLSVYQPQTTTLNGQAVYLGLNWTLKSATASPSLAGEQAARGMRYVTLTISVNNTLSQTVISGSPYVYARLKSGNTLAVPVDSSLPLSFQSGASGVAGTLSFLVPQKSTAFSLIFLPQGQNSNDQATFPFVIHA
ncbi:MAG TPA: zinc ribbon domain-containing protein [Ktedonobacteraceae bacterium]|nr:zinc ribbon domain-containing protein [Ktedonobacteraceae bacterium]